MTIVIADSTILILFVKTDLFELLYQKYKEIVIPSEVYEEAIVRGKSRKKEDAFYLEERVKNKKITITTIQNRKKRDEIIGNFGLHKGEAECIVLFYEISADFLGSDDKKTINVCKIFQIPFFSVISFILACVFEKSLTKERAIIKLDILQKAGWYKASFLSMIRDRIMNMEVN